MWSFYSALDPAYVDTASFGAAEHDQLVRKCSVITPTDVAESFIVFGCGFYCDYFENLASTAWKAQQNNGGR